MVLPIKYKEIGTQTDKLKKTSNDVVFKRIKNPIIIDFNNRPIIYYQPVEVK